MDRITIVGMGPIGTAIGLGLKRAQLKHTEIVGTSRERGFVATALKMGALDQGIRNLRSALEGAELVILDTDLNETKELLPVLGEILAEGTVVTDTSATKAPVIEWADASFNNGVSFVGGHPLPKRVIRTHEDADPSIFDEARYCVIPSKSANPEAVAMVVGMVERLGSEPFFLDALEHDVYAAAMSSLPILLSSALVTSLSSSESWRDMSSLAASEFREVTRLASTDPEEIRAACMANSEHVVHWIDKMITELYSYRTNIQESNDEFMEMLIAGWEARAKWERGVVEEPQGPEMPSMGETMSSMFVGSRLAKRHSDLLNKNKKSPWKYKRTNS